MRFKIENGILLRCYEPVFRKTVTVPSEVNVIERYAFAECRHLTTVYLPEHLTSIGEKAFKECTSLRTLVPVSQKGREGVILPEGLIGVDSYAFHGCCSLTSVTLPSTVQWIGKYAFAGCRSLTSFTLPETVNDLGRKMLMDCFTARQRIPGDITSGLVWSELMLTICRADGQHFSFPIRHDEMVSAGISETVLNLLIEKKLYANIPRPVRCKFVRLMLENGYLTEEYILSDARAFLCSLINDNNTEAVKLLLDTGTALPKLPAALYDELLLQTNQQQQYEMQLLLMEAIQKYCSKDRFSL